MPAKNKIKNIPKEDGVVHVKLDSPMAVRKSVLGAALDVANLLTTYEEIKTFKKNKSEIFDSINIQLSALNKDIKDLEFKYLPEIKFAHLNPVEKNVHAEKEIQQNKVVDNMSDSEVEKLKTELAEIEKRLKHL